MGIPSYGWSRSGGKTGLVRLVVFGLAPGSPTQPGTLFSVPESPTTQPPRRRQLNEGGWYRPVTHHCSFCAAFLLLLAAITISMIAQ
ncbi:hypothetical protein CISG_06134 [Coccidioides immitis RMSCC 3703]|uniref:Uncharacterized protein n=1 Tax=Coccidioides immitis RMSCC 3703 TaxID=454286 RepID=A0A0J8QXE4_COCIT|nr:hypothetical protein CISG_06134 [Coccidioides immitis RMSCC 3703]